jgi:flagellar hook assembly protein FlgD
VEENQATPNAFALGANYPNPFNAGTAIPYVTSAPGSLELNIYDVRGALVRQLVSRSLPGGPHLTHWDGRDEAGRSVGSGLYVYRLVAEGKVQTALLK